MFQHQEATSQTLLNITSCFIFCKFCQSKQKIKGRKHQIHFCKHSKFDPIHQVTNILHNMSSSNCYKRNFKRKYSKTIHTEEHQNTCFRVSSTKIFKEKKLSQKVKFWQTLFVSHPKTCHTTTCCLAKQAAPHFFMIFAIWQFYQCLQTNIYASDDEELPSCHKEKEDKTKNANAVQCHSLLSGNKDCYEFRFSIVRIVISVSNVTSLLDCRFHCLCGCHCEI